MILISLFAFAYGSIGAGDGRSRPPELPIADLDQTRSSREIIHRIHSLETIKVVASEANLSRELVIKGKYACALIIPKGYQDALEAGKPLPVELMVDRSREMEIGLLQQSLISALMSSAGELIVKKNISAFLRNQFPALDPSAIDPMLKAATNTGHQAITLKWTSVVGVKSDTSWGLIQAVSGTAILMLLFSVAGVGTSLLEEKENGTINRLLCSPLKSGTILYGKMLFAFFLSILQLTAMFVFAWLIFKLNLSLNIPGLILMITATSLAVSSLGIFLAAVAKTRRQAQNLGTLIILVMSAMGGSMIPLFIMPALLQKIAVLSLNYWGIRGFYDLFWRALPLEEILPEILVLIGIGIALTLASILLFKKRLVRS